MSPVSEATVESAVLAWLEGAGWAVAHGPDIAPDMPGAERGDYGEVVLRERLRSALARLNPHLPQVHVLLEGAYAPHRFLALIRDFIVFEDDGSGALVICMSRRICIDLCRELVRLRPDWQGVGGDGIDVETFLLTPVGDWLKP